ncbi:hypothetical protein D3C81_1045010 [compost metagenome]
MAYEVKIDVSPVYELVSSFMIYTTRKWVNNLDVGHEWMDQIQPLINEKTRHSFAEAAALPFTDYDILYAFAIERNDSDRIEDFLTDLEEGDEVSLLHKVTPYIDTVNSEDIIRLKKYYVPLLRTWNELYFKPLCSHYESLLQEDAAEKELLLHKMDPEALIEYASGGLVLEPHLPIKRVVLLPSIHFRPINTYCFYHGTLLIQYPIDIPELDEDEPPTYLVRLTRALAKPERLRLLRYIADQPKSLQDIIHDLNETEDQLMHHLMRLRVAGLLRVHLIEKDTEKFTIRPDGASELQMFLESYIRL